MQIRHSIIILLLQSHVHFSFAQSDSIAFSALIDSSVEVNATRFSEGISTQYFSKTVLQNYQGQSLSEILNREAGIFIKQYGAGLLATVTHRGGSAAQTAVLWEGVNILNPMLGQSDLNLLPVLFSDAVQWQSGGSSALNGNNAIGGSLQIGSKSDFNSGWKGLGFLQMGRFGEQKQQLRLQYGDNRYAGSLRAFYQRADNDYLFRDVNAFGNPKPLKKLSNAAQEAWGLMQENSLRLGKGQLLSWKHWYQNAYRQIPPNLLQTAGDGEEQWDEALRNVLSWQKIGSKTSWKADGAFIWERLDYENKVLRSESRTLTALARLEQNIAIVDAQTLRWGLEYQYQSAFSDNYKRGQQQIAAYAAHKIRGKNWTLNLSAREQWVAKRWLLPALGANFFYTKTDKKQNQYSLQASASHNYRFPTLNDRFWPIGGNPDLLPEYSLSTDLKFKLISAGNRLQYRLEIGGYSNYVRNWIQWSPASGSGLWEPQNIARVWALGPEVSGLLDYRVAAHNFSLRGQYQLNRARRIGEADISLQNKQLIYTPEHCAAASFDWTFRQAFSLRYRHNFFSTRFLDNANSQTLPAYQLGWLQMEYILNFKDLRLRLHATVDNLWAADYQAVANRPMPRRGLSVGLMMGF